MLFQSPMSIILKKIRPHSLEYVAPKQTELCNMWNVLFFLSGNYHRANIPVGACSRDAVGVASNLL